VLACSVLGGYADRVSAQICKGFTALGCSFSNLATPELERLYSMTSRMMTFQLEPRV
jgi:hypothetical protein